MYKTGVLSHESLPPPLPPVVVPAFKEGTEEFYVSSNQEPGSVHIFVTVETPYSLFFLYGVATSRLKQKGYKAEQISRASISFSPPTPPLRTAQRTPATRVKQRKTLADIVCVCTREFWVITNEKDIFRQHRTEEYITHEEHFTLMDLDKTHKIKKKIHL